MVVLATVIVAMVLIMVNAATAMDKVVPNHGLVPARAAAVALDPDLALAPVAVVPGLDPDLVIRAAAADHAIKTVEVTEDLEGGVAGVEAEVGVEIRHRY